MLTDTSDTSLHAALDKRRLQALGVLLPIRLHTMSFLSGRHPLGRAGEGMRFLRTRPFESGHDNPRDIDKFSPAGERWVNEWEAEAQAAVHLYADLSGSMSFGSKAAVRNLALLQFTYSLWRASDWVSATFSIEKSKTVAEKNLKSQLEALSIRLESQPVGEPGNPFETLAAIASERGRNWKHLAFHISDYCAVDGPGAVQNTHDWRAAVRRAAMDIVPVIVSFALQREQTGTIKLRDAETGKQRLTLLTPSRIDKINRREALRVEELQLLFRRLGFDYLTVRNEKDVYPALARLAKLRRRQGK